MGESGAEPPEPIEHDHPRGGPMHIDPQTAAQIREYGETGRMPVQATVEEEAMLARELAREEQPPSAKPESSWPSAARRKAGAEGLGETYRALDAITGQTRPPQPPPESEPKPPKLPEQK